MRITCPLCGERDLREFHYRGSADLLNRPKTPEGMFDYVYLRDNPAGLNKELWQHEYGCRAWLHVERNTVTHDIASVSLARDVKRDAS